MSETHNSLGCLLVLICRATAVPRLRGDVENRSGTWREIVLEPKFYYLNPRSIDWNLEWDMKNNLCWLWCYGIRPGLRRLFS